MEVRKVWFTGAAFLKVLGELLQLAHSSFHIGPLPLLQAVLDVVLDQFFLRLADRGLDRMELLGQVKAGLAFLDHGDDRSEVPFGPLEAGDDVGGDSPPFSKRVFRGLGLFGWQGLDRRWSWPRA